MKLRSAANSDLPYILEIFNDVIENTLAIYSHKLMSSTDIEKWFENKSIGRWPVLVVEIEHKAVGFASLGTFRTSEGYQSTVELSIHVHRDFRGQGVGTKLFQAIIKQAQEKKYHCIVSAIDSTNTGSIALHYKHGFKVAGVIEQVAQKFDRWLDLTLMQRILS